MLIRSWVIDDFLPFAWEFILFNTTIIIYYVFNEYSLIHNDINLSLIIVYSHRHPTLDFFRKKNHQFNWKIFYYCNAHTHKNTRFFQKYINDLVAWFLMIFQKKILLTNTQIILSTFILFPSSFFVFLHTKNIF